jgi:RNA polymerase sigma factor (sigma-70 family)
MRDLSKDEDLVTRVAEGDLAAFSEIYDRYARRLHAWSTHLLGPERAEDAMQEIFLQLWQHATQFDSERGPFATWFSAVARHHLLHAMRQENARRRLIAAAEIAEVLAGASSPLLAPEERVSQREEGEALLGALRMLPDEQRQVVVLAYFGGLSQSQIAEQLGLPLGTVKKRIRLAMAKLRGALVPRLVQAGGPPEDQRGAARRAD